MKSDDKPACRVCGSSLDVSLIDFGAQPLANNYLETAEAARTQPRYRLHARVCAACFLVQLDAVVPPEQIFTDYAYLSSYSETWLEHCRVFARTAIERFGLSGSSLVVELASNDGHLLRHFRDLGIGVLGVEPAANVAKIAEKNGVPTEVCFFGREVASDIAERFGLADFVVANNVLAHVPDLVGFVAGIRRILAPEGVVSVEFPHLVNLLRGNQFDTIYHEHYSYLSLMVVERVFADHGLRVFDVEELPTHGGSLRVTATRSKSAHGVGRGPTRVRSVEREYGLDQLGTYEEFGARADEIRRDFVEFVTGANSRGQRVAAYGAAAKGNTLLNYCGITADDIKFVADRNPLKRGRFLPGSAIPISEPERLANYRPNYVAILPWNLAGEVLAQLSHLAERGTRFLTAIPAVRLLN